VTNRAEFLSAVFGSALAGGTVVPLSTFSTLTGSAKAKTGELRNLAARTLQS
jgi:acyl-CoA synthetase (AMP-forming)/AMP-acid ligase II